MKRYLLATGLLAALATQPCFGQETVSEAKIPFAFEAGKVFFPPGEYTVRQTPTYIRIDGDRLHSAFLSGVPTTRHIQGDLRCLKFRVYGDKYFLSEVWTGDKGNVLPTSKTERLVAQNDKGVNPKGNTLATNRLPK